MKKEIREVDQKRGIIQCTFYDERWYAKPSMNEVSGLPEYKFVPSVTWIAGHYPKGIGFYKWLAEHNWDEAQAIKQAAGDKGSKVHNAIAAAIAEEEVRVDSKFVNPSTNQLEELTSEEVECVMGFLDWRKEMKPETVAWDVVVFSDKGEFAGTIDYICRIKGELYIVDFKTSQYVWTEMEMQVSAYRVALREQALKENMLSDAIDYKLAILQIGYRKNKAGYKWNEIEDIYPLFLNAKAIWARETAGQAPRKRDFPIVLSPGKVKKTETKELPLKTKNKK